MSAGGWCRACSPPGTACACLVRDPARLQGRPWLSQVEVAEGDVLQPGDARPGDGIGRGGLLPGAQHGWPTATSRHRTSRRPGPSARRRAQAGVRRIIYLGGLGDPQADLSEHLRSRQQTGEALREAGVPVTEFRAAVIVGSGSLSFEMIRYLTERLPVMICPRWVFTRIQPIAIDDVLEYLIAALETPAAPGASSRSAGRRDHLRRHDARLRRGARPAPAADRRARC